MEQCDIKLYALSTCSHCRSTKELLDRCQVHYDCVDLDTLEGEQRKKVIEEVKKLNPKCTLPTLVIGDKIVVGFREDRIKEALGIR
jgi:glutaredoxin-like protein NrdH|uniref:Glutaredoxin family protein n=1 Tax=Desulfobacca acetoxidans TaxID=60893 RepID=A0A7V6A402_9BACT